LNAEIDLVAVYGSIRVLIGVVAGQGREAAVQVHAALHLRNEDFVVAIAIPHTLSSGIGKEDHRQGDRKGDRCTPGGVESLAHETLHSHSLVSPMNCEPGLTAP
jgi:hypothetical protein